VVDDLLIIIVNYNTVDLLAGCIKSIYEYPPKCKFSVVVADNGSKDSSLCFLNKKFPIVKVISLKKNFGFAKAANSALKNCNTSFALLLNPDSKLFPGTIDQMMEFIKANPKVGIAGAKHLGFDNKLQLTWGRFPGIKNEIIRKALHVSLFENRAGNRKYLENMAKSTTRVDWVSGSCMLVRKQAWQKAGLLDENFFMYFEDIDWCKRIDDSGFEIRFISDAPVLHIGGECARRNLVDAMVGYRKSQLYFIGKYFGFGTKFAVRLMIAAKAMLLLTVTIARRGFSLDKDELKKEKAMAVAYKKILTLTLLPIKIR